MVTRMPIYQNEQNRINLIRQLNSIGVSIKKESSKKLTVLKKRTFKESVMSPCEEMAMSTEESAKFAK